MEIEEKIRRLVRMIGGPVEITISNSLELGRSITIFADGNVLINSTTTGIVVTLDRALDAAIASATALLNARILELQEERCGEIARLELARGT